jgi:hypothetical protein
MKYLSKSFSTPANSRAYVENWDAVFGEKPAQAACVVLTDPNCACSMCELSRLTEQYGGYDELKP